MSKYDSDVSGGQVGAIGDSAEVHFHAPPPPTPLQRPPRAEHFTDREQELQRLLDDLQPGQVATLCGPGGIGKTALAAEAVWTLAPNNEPPERFPDGILFHSFYQEPQAAVALESFVRAYGEEPRPTSRNAAMRALSGKQALLIHVCRGVWLFSFPSSTAFLHLFFIKSSYVHSIILDVTRLRNTWKSRVCYSAR